MSSEVDRKKSPNEVNFDAQGDGTKFKLLVDCDSLHAQVWQSIFLIEILQ